MLYPKIISAKIIENYTLLVHFSNHQARKYDCKKLLEKTMFSPLKNYAFLKTFNSIHQVAESFGMMKLI
jgi:hypothetical protein